MCKMYSHYSRETALPEAAVSAFPLKATDYKHTHAHVRSLINISAKSHLGPGMTKHAPKPANNESRLSTSHKLFHNAHKYDHTSDVLHLDSQSPKKVNEIKERKMALKREAKDKVIFVCKPERKLSS